MGFRYSSDDGHFGPAKDYGGYDDTRGLFSENDRNDMSNVMQSPFDEPRHDHPFDGPRRDQPMESAAQAMPGGGGMGGAAGGTPWGAIVGALAMYKGNLDRIANKRKKADFKDLVSITHPAQSGMYGNTQFTGIMPGRR